MFFSASYSLDVQRMRHAAFRCKHFFQQIVFSPMRKRFAHATTPRNPCPFAAIKCAPTLAMLHSMHGHRMHGEASRCLPGCLQDVCPDASSLPSLPRTREPTACQAPATHLLCGYAYTRSTGGAGVDLRCAADVLIHPPVPKKKATWRIRGCGATRSSPRPPSLGSHVVRP